MAVNQRNVAQLAGVSSATVSRYLTDPSRVKSGTAERIQSAIDTLGYRLDYFAKSLRTGKGANIGILVPGVGPFYWEVLQAIQDRLVRGSYFSTIFYTRDIDINIHSSHRYFSDFLSNNMIEGIIFFPLMTEPDREILNKMKHYHDHIVIADSDIDESSLDRVLIDSYGAGRRAAQELLKRGHREMLFLHGAKTAYSASERLKGFGDELAQAGFPLTEDRIVEGDFSSRTAYQLGRKLAPILPKFTAVFAVNDSSAMGFMRAASESGILCPRDYSIIGFDNNREFTSYTTPSLSTFQQPLSTMGRLIAERLIGQIESQLEPTRVVLDTEFIERESVRYV